MEDVTNTSANDNTQGTEVVEQQKEVQQETQSADTLLGGKAETQPQEEAEPIAYDFKETISAMDDFEFSQEESDKFVERSLRIWGLTMSRLTLLLSMAANGVKASQKLL